MNFFKAHVNNSYVSDGVFSPVITYFVTSHAKLLSFGHLNALIAPTNSLTFIHVHVYFSSDWFSKRDTQT